MKHFLAETVESADAQEGIQGYSVASVDAACDVTSEVTECESGVRLCLYQPGCRAFFFYFKRAGGECSTGLRCSCCKGQKGGTGHGRSGNTNPLTFTLSPTLASFCLVQNVRARPAVESELCFISTVLYNSRESHEPPGRASRHAICHDTMFGNHCPHRSL